jgi:hypothetical protein
MRYRSEGSTVIVSSPAVMTTMRALPLEQFMHLCVAIGGCCRTRVHAVDGRVASHDIVAGGVVL